MKKVILGVVTLLLLGIVIFIGMQFSSNKVKVLLEHCIDGDTASFLIHGKKQTVRFLGIDTPEITKGKNEEYGKEASDYTCQLLSEGKDIYLEYDLNSDQYDKYGRVLAWVFVDNHNLSELLLSKGYARVRYIYGDYQYLDTLCKVQEESYHKRIGIWEKDVSSYQNNYCVKLK